MKDNDLIFLRFKMITAIVSFFLIIGHTRAIENEFSESGSLQNSESSIRLERTNSQMTVLESEKNEIENLNQPEETDLTPTTTALASDNALKLNEFDPNGSYVLSEINLRGLKWENFGISKGVYFTDALSRSWGNYLLQMKKNNKNMLEFLPCLDGCSSFFNWMQTFKSEDRQKSYQGKWIKISINLFMINSDEEKREHLYGWEGTAVLIDMNTKRVLASFNLEKEEKLIKGKTTNDTNSILASSIYHSGLKGLTQFSSYLAHSNSESHKVREVKVSGYRHMADLLELVDKIRNKGIFTELDSFKINEATLKCYISGEEKKFKDTLVSIMELKSKSHYKVINDHQGRRYEMRLITQ